MNRQEGSNEQTEGSNAIHYPKRRIQWDTPFVSYNVTGQKVWGVAPAGLVTLYGPVGLRWGFKRK